MIIDVPEWDKLLCINTVSKKTSDNEPCVSDAYVICTSAIGDEPLQVEKSDGAIEIGGKCELDKKDITLNGQFDGCKSKGLCRISESQIEDQEWKDTGIYKDTNNGQTVLDHDTSYMLCTFGPGIIYFTDAGQKCKDFVEKISRDEMQLLELAQWIKSMEIGDIYNASNKNYLKINGIYYILPQNAKDGYVTLGYGHAIQTNDDARKYGFFNVQGYQNFDFSEKHTSEEIDIFINAYKAYYNTNTLCPGIMSQETATLTLLDDLKLAQGRAITAIGGIAEKNKYTANELNALTSILYNGNHYTSSGSLSYYLIKSNGNYTQADALNVVEQAETNGVYKSQGEGIFRRRLMEINIYYNDDYTFYDDLDMGALKAAVGCTLP